MMELSPNLRKILRTKTDKDNISRLTNSDFSLITSNCVGGVIAHSLKQRFNSPTVNLWFYNTDFVLFCKDLRRYLYEVELVEDRKLSESLKYPVGKLENILLFFLHYDSFEEAKEKWNVRKERVNFDNIFLIMVQDMHDGIDLLREYDNLPYNKLVFTINDYPDIKSAIHIEGTTKDGNMKDMCSYESRFSAHRLIDRFDYVDYLNGVPVKQCRHR